ncbi:hypothetical protein [Algoriphagus aquimarinus]|uniref:hypothetical protein n=1 Tax=Algoriphagus aquimarinus TaxID=237018 RepID=UPI001587A26C|nr:hypothetical protein [Algoriphagus aquimarinus]
MNYQLGIELMNTKKVFYLLILLAVIYNLMLMYTHEEEPREADKTTLNIKTNLIESR